MQLRKKSLLLALLPLLLILAASANGELPKLTLKSLDGKAVELRSFQNKVLLVTNTASLCGFTPQYRDLESLYQQFKDKGLVVLGFPSNDFNSQDPGTDAEIKKFCSFNYKISFPMFTKNSVIGAKIQPMFSFLTDSPDESLRGEIGWNFEKFLVDKKGVVRARYGSFVNPMNKKITSKIEELLSEFS